MASGAVGVSKELASAEEVKEGTVVSLSEAGAVVEMVVAEVAAVAAVGAGGCTESSGAGLEGGTLFRAVTLGPLLGRGPVLGGKIGRAHV